MISAQERTKSRKPSAWWTLLIAGLFLTACQSDGDRLVVPTPKAAEFSDMTLSCLYAGSINDIFVGGWFDRIDGTIEGVILRSRDAGKTWKRVGSETFDFRGVIVQNLHFNDRIRGWFSGIRVGEESVTAIAAATQNGGGHWRYTVIPESRASLISNTQELVFVTDRIGSVEIVFEDAQTSELLTNVYRTDDGGRNWIIDGFKDIADDEISDPGTVNFSPAQGYRLLPADEFGVQAVEYTATGGETWVPAAKLHLSRFGEFY